MIQSNTTQIENANTRAKAAVDKALALCRTIDPFQLSRELDQFQIAHQTLASTLQVGKERESHYSTLVGIFKSAFTAVYQSATYINIPQLLQSASGLHSNIIGDHEVLRLISADLAASNLNTDVEGLERLTLYYESQQSVSDIQAKLTALLSIYSELCELLGISTSQHPLRLQKIETGSFWVNVLGYPKIIDLMEKYFDAAIAFLHRSFTREGKLSQIPRNVEQIDSVLNLRKSLALQGLPTDQLDVNISKAAVKLSSSLNVLLGSEPVVQVNGTRFSLEAELQRRMIEQRGIPKLTHDSSAGQDVADQQP